MPQLFSLYGYVVYFWSNENRPLEPVHVHIAKRSPSPHGTKVWITKAGHSLLCHNRSRIPEKTLRLILQIIEANSSYIVKKRSEHFEETHFFC